MPNYQAHQSTGVPHSSMETKPSMVSGRSEHWSSPTANLENFVSYPHWFGFFLLILYIVSDATILLRDIAGDAAQNAATRVNPSQDQLSQIDKPADDNTWHDTPDLSRGNLKNQVKSQYNQQKPFSRDEVKNAAGDATQSAHPSGSRDPADAANLAARDHQHGSDSGVDGYGGLKTGAQTLRDQASQNIPDETKDRAHDIEERTRNKSRGYLKEKLPQERRDQTVYRLKKMVVEIQGHQDCKIILLCV